MVVIVFHKRFLYVFIKGHRWYRSYVTVLHTIDFCIHVLRTWFFASSCPDAEGNLVSTVIGVFVNPWELFLFNQSPDNSLPLNTCCNRHICWYMIYPATQRGGGGNSVWPVLYIVCLIANCWGGGLSILFEHIDHRDYVTSNFRISQI